MTNNMIFLRLDKLGGALALLMALGVPVAEGAASRPVDSTLPYKDAGESPEAVKDAVLGQSIALTADWDTQYRVRSADACKALRAKESSIGGLPLTISYVVGGLTLVDAPCKASIKLGDKGLPNYDGDIGRSYVDPKNPEYSGYASAVGVYAIGTAPYMLLVIEPTLTFEGNEGPLTDFSLYLVRSTKAVEVLHGEMHGYTPIRVRNDILTIVGFYRHHDGDECESCEDPETVSFNLDPARGLVHWHAQTPRAAESIHHWLNEADPAFRAQEVDRAKAFEQAAQQQIAQAKDEKKNGWWVMNRDGDCILMRLALSLKSPADMIEFDEQNGLQDDVVIIQRDSDGKPMSVRVGEPSNSNLETFYEFYKGFDVCDAAAAAKQDKLKDLN